MAEYIPFSIAVFSFKLLIVIEICHFSGCPKEIKINSIFHGVSFPFSSSLLAQFLLKLFATSAIAISAGMVASTDIPADPINQASACRSRQMHRHSLMSPLQAQCRYIARSLGTYRSPIPKEQKCQALTL